MFQNACKTVRESVYELVARTKTKKGKRFEIACSNGSGFMISPGIVATAAHITHKGNTTGPNHTEFLVIRAPDIGSSFEKATLLAEDKVRDIAFLKIENPKSTISLTLEESIIPRGTDSTFPTYEGIGRQKVRPRHV